MYCGESEADLRERIYKFYLDVSDYFSRCVTNIFLILYLIKNRRKRIMNKEFHYYITFILCRKAGFDADESYKIAYSSQYTDDNDSHTFVNFNGGGGFISKISQTMDITKPTPKHKSIYPYFHFIPGGKEGKKFCNFKDELVEACQEKSNFKCGSSNCLLTIPNSENAQDLLKEALNEEDRNLLLFRIGIAIHAYADTWSHQNFVGYNHILNSNKTNLIDLKLGHANFKHDPDEIDNKWKDERLDSDNEIDNNERFLQAAKEIFLRLYMSKNGVSKLDAAEKYGEIELEENLKEALSRSVFDLFIIKNTRLNAYKKICPELKLKKYEYNEKDWFKEAVQKNTGFWGFSERNVFDKYQEGKNFKDSNWYKFQKAVEKHLKYCKKKFEVIYNKHKFEMVAYE
jgi:hypothetical protein